MVWLDYDYEYNLYDKYYGCLDTDYDSVTVKVDEDLQNILEYYFKKKYNKCYNPLSWYLEDGAKELFKELETKWFKNKIDTFELYHLNNDFKEFLLEKYATEACILAEKSVIDFTRSEYEEEDVPDGFVNYAITGDYLEAEDEVYL